MEKIEESPTKHLQTILKVGIYLLPGTTCPKKYPGSVIGSAKGSSLEANPATPFTFDLPGADPWGNPCISLDPLLNPLQLRVYISASSQSYAPGLAPGSEPASGSGSAWLHPWMYFGLAPGSSSSPSSPP